MSGQETARDLRAAAYHEAGHAVAHVKLQLPLLRVTIVPDGDSAGQTLGRPLPPSVRSRIDEFSELTPRIRDRLEREVMSFLAGEVAQEIGTGTTEGSALYVNHPVHGQVIVDGDWHHVVDLLGRLGGGEEETNAYANLLHLRTQRLLRDPITWAHVELVAEALLARRRLAGREVAELRRAAVERARPARSCSPAV